MRDILEEIDDVIADWHGSPDSARWSPDPLVMDAIEDARSHNRAEYTEPVNSSAADGPITVELSYPNTEGRRARLSRSLVAAGYCAHILEDGRSATINSRRACAICTTG